MPTRFKLTVRAILQSLAGLEDRETSPLFLHQQRWSLARTHHLAKGMHRNLQST
jgi:hypothetical protein